MRCFGIAILLTAIAVSGRMLCADEGVTVWATECTPIDLSVNECRLAVGEVAVWHTPDWCTGGTNVEGAVAVLKAVANPDTANAATTTVSLVDGVNLGSIDWTGSGYSRLIMNAELDGELIGSTLVKDISFGAESAFSAGYALDVRTNALQEIVNARKDTSLTYDLRWADDVASNAEISVVCTKRAKNGTLLSVVTSELHSVDAPVAGSFSFATKNLGWGDYVLLLREYSGDGSLLLETQSPEFSIAHVYGTCVVIR